jgi:hypothetical protein
MDLPRPTASVGTRTGYSVGPWGLLSVCHTAPDGVRRKDYGGQVFG